MSEEEQEVAGQESLENDLKSRQRQILNLSRGVLETAHSKVPYDADSYKLTFDQDGKPVELTIKSNQSQTEKPHEVLLEIPLTEHEGVEVRQSVLTAQGMAPITPPDRVGLLIADQGTTSESLVVLNGGGYPQGVSYPIGDFPSIARGLFDRVIAVLKEPVVDTQTAEPDPLLGSYGSISFSK